MAKKSSMLTAVGNGPSEDEYQTRDDVDRLLRADEVHQDSKRHARALSRLTGVVQRLTPKKTSRSGGRNSGR